MSVHPGIQERRGRAGATYRARVRKGGAVITRSFATLPAALAWRAQVLEAVTDGGEVPPPPALAPARSLTVEDAARVLARGMVDGTVRTRTGTRYKPSVVRKYEEQLRTLVVPLIGPMPVAAITKGDVQRLVDAIAARRTPEHARKALVALRVLMRVAERDGAIPPGAGPCEGVRAPADDHGRRPVRILTPEEVMRILAAAEADDHALGRSLGAPLIALLFGTGLRLGEALALPWGAEGIDLDAGVVRVRRSLDRVRDPRTGTFALVPPKTRTSRREVPLRPTDAAMLRRHRLATSRPADGAFVFADERGEALPPNGRPRHGFQRAVRRAGLAEPLPKLHDLRHAYASALLAAGLIGHSSPALVMARYGHVYADEKATSAMALERLVAGRSASLSGR
jgi:integrase